MGRILVSDDEPQVLRIVGRCLERAGHDVVVTRDPSEVAALARESRFDAVVLDVVMTPKSGLEILRELRADATTAETPVLLLSGRSAGPDRVLGLREGADDYLVKPFEPEELQLRVERLVARGSRRFEPAARDARFLGRYEVREVLGEGTMGTVYRGWDPRLNRPVALKTIRLEPIALDSRRREMLERLRNEAVTIASFNHPNIVTVYDMGDSEGGAFIAMELVDGVSFARHLDVVGAVAAPELFPVGLGVARALEAAHERGVLHRDVKPGNVLLSRDGGIKVTDFGLAGFFREVAVDSNHLCGTPGYVPPEALAQKPYTPAGDLFGLGAMLYEAAAGAHPLTGSSLRETIERTRAGRVTPLLEVRPGIPGELADLVMELMASDPARRPAAAAVVERLERMGGRG